MGVRVKMRRFPVGVRPHSVTVPAGNNRSGHRGNKWPKPCRPDEVIERNAQAIAAMQQCLQWVQAVGKLGRLPRD